MENSQDRNAFNKDKEAKERQSKEDARTEDQLASGEVTEAQVERAKQPHLAEADFVDGVLEDKAEVDPQFAGKGTAERLAELPVAPLTVEEQDKVVQADQEIRAALSQAEEGIPDIPNAEGDDKEIVDGAKEAEQAEKKLAEDAAKAARENAPAEREKKAK